MNPASSSSDSQPNEYQIWPTLTIDRYSTQGSAHSSRHAQTGHSIGDADEQRDRHGDARPRDRGEEPVGVVELEKARCPAERRSRRNSGWASVRARRVERGTG